MTTLLLLLALAGPSIAGSPAPAAYVGVSVKEGTFRCEAPRGWLSQRDERLDAREKTYGVFLVGPRDAGVALKISVRYYPPGNKLFADADSYLKRNLQGGPIALPEEKTGPVEPVTAGGLRGKRFARRTFEYPPGRDGPREVPVTEEVVVLPAARGFYVLEYAGPSALHRTHEPAFQHVLATFRTDLPQSPQ